MKWINADEVIHAQVYDDEHEEWSEREMTIEAFLDAFTDEGCPNVVTQPEQQWILCSDRLPEKEYVLISKKRKNYFDDGQCIAIAIRIADARSGKINWRDTNFGVVPDDNVLAWMPLPEAYKEVTE